MIEQLIEYGETRRGWLGVRIQPVTEDIASSLGMNGASGALVVSVDDDGPAKQAGIKSGDIILKFNDVVIDTMRELPRVVAETKVGTRAEVEIWRKNKVINKSVVIERLNEGSLVPVESPDVEDNTDVDNTSVLNLGFSLSNVSKELAAKYDFTPNQKGLVVTQIDNQSDAFKRGLQEGDVINVINEPDLYSVNQFIRIIDKYKKADKNLLLIKVVRGKNMIRVFPIDISID